MRRGFRCRLTSADTARDYATYIKNEWRPRKNILYLHGNLVPTRRRIHRRSGNSTKLFMNHFWNFQKFLGHAGMKAGVGVDRSRITPWSYCVIVFWVLWAVRLCRAAGESLPLPPVSGQKKPWNAIEHTKSFWGGAWGRRPFCKRVPPPQKPFNLKTALPWRVSRAVYE